MKYKITGSIVLYKNDEDVLLKSINCFSDLDIHLYLIDNSPTNNLGNVVYGRQIEYIHDPTNPGFGAAHNTAIEKATVAGSIYHFIINPDVYFKGDIIYKMADFMKSNPDIGMLMPEVRNPDDRIQNLPKLLPSPLDVVLRKLKKPTLFYKKFIDKYELRFVSRDTIYNAPILSGCFTLLNLNAVKEIGVYDDKYFMYFEDWDLSRRMTEKYQTIYFPEVHIYHEYDSGANKSFHLFKIFLKSAFYYFNKWGWFFDRRRKVINEKTLAQFK